MRIATAREGESGIRLVTNKERITTPNIRKPRKKWLPSCKTSGLKRNVENIFRPLTDSLHPHSRVWIAHRHTSLLIAHQPSSLWIVHQHSRLWIANRHSKEESQRV